MFKNEVKIFVRTRNNDDLTNVICSTSKSISSVWLPKVEAEKKVAKLQSRYGKIGLNVTIERE